MSVSEKEQNHRLLLSVTSIFLVCYVALSYPQLGTSFKEAFGLGAFLLTLVLWALDREIFRAYAHRMITDPMVWGVAFICVWGLAAALITGAQLDDTARHLDIYRKVMLKGVMVFLVVTYVCFRRKSSSMIFITLAVVGAAACLDVIAGYGLNYVTAANRGAVHTILNKRIHVNLMSLKLNFVAPFFVALVWKLKGKKGQFWLVYAASILVLVASFLTISRAGWLGAVGGLFFLFFFARARKQLLIAIAIFIVIFGLTYLGSKDVREHVATLKQRLPHISERLPNWELCLKAAGQQPVWGWGVFEQETFHRMVRIVDGPNSKILKYQYPHNVFLELTLMWGLPFMIVLAALFFYIYWKAWAGPPSDFRSRLQMAAIAGGTIGALWINGFFSEVVWPDVFIALALASSVLAGRPEPEA